MGFRRTIEDFTCDYCGAHNVGDGYTNHCAKCLHSKHVDIEPGDRAASCGGLMVPTGALVRSDRVTLIQECEVCGHTRPCRTSPADDREAVIAVASGAGVPSGSGGDDRGQGGATPPRTAR